MIVGDDRLAACFPDLTGDLTGWWRAGAPNRTSRYRCKRNHRSRSAAGQRGTLQAAQALQAAGIAVIAVSTRVPPIHRIAVLHPYIEVAVCSKDSIGEPVAVTASSMSAWHPTIPAPQIRELLDRARTKVG